MKNKPEVSVVLKIAASLLVIAITSIIYVTQLNQTVNFNMLNTINELAQHDKKSMEAFIQSCWSDLEEITLRFEIYDCRTIPALETRISQECATSNFTHLYLIGDDGTVYTDDIENIDTQPDLLSCFAEGEKKFVTSWEDSEKYLLYGILLDNFEVEGKKMYALLGLSKISNIQKYINFDSFLKEGNSRGYSSVIDMEGGFIFGAEKAFYLDDPYNPDTPLSPKAHSDLTREEVILKLNHHEIFHFHYTDNHGIKRLLYFIPFEDNINWYFMMAVESEAFTERSRAFAFLSMGLLAVVMFVAVVLMTALSVSRYRTIQAVARQKSQSEFLSNMSHEIRTPLNGLIGLNHLVMTHIDQKGQEAQIKDWLQKSQSTANYLLSLVNDVLDMSKLQAGKVDIIREPVLVETIVDAVWSMQRDNIEGRGVSFILQQDLPVPCVMGDATRIKQVLMNIVGNAAKFTPRGGTITMAVSQEVQDEHHVTTTFVCQDTGVGMSEEFTATIFDAFTQERNKAACSTQGTGLGMAISKFLVNAMDGQIHVESALGKGTTFWVVLPSEAADTQPDYLHQHTEETAADAEAFTDTLHSDRPVKVMVAEDVELNAEILMAILEEEGFETVHAENGQEAVDLFTASALGEFDIILMDMQMPVMDGCTASKTIRSLERPDADSVIIFACTANTFKEDRDRAVESGMNDFLAKPIDIKVLLNKLTLRGHAPDCSI